ncbi:MAG: hypothetical protein SFW65_00230 [Alphaproteobacteria bacterium]|nr:hypothetical protein [Alphaproteobacteria bacterium]
MSDSATDKQQPQQQAASHARMIGQGIRSDISELSPLGSFIERMFGEAVYRKDMARLLGISEKYLSNILNNISHPSQPWLIEMGWEAILSNTSGWKADPASAKKEFNKLLDASPLQASHEQKPPVTGTMGEIFDIVYPGLKRLEQAAALGIPLDRHAMAGFANGNKMSQEKMALSYIRGSLQRDCAGRIDEHTGHDLWDVVAPKYDAIAHAKITTRIASTNTGTIKQWRAAVGEVFRRVRAYAAPLDKAEVFFETFDNAQTPIFANGHYDMSGGYYKAMEEGRGFDENGYLTPNGVMTSKDYQKTRALYLRVATQMVARYLGDAQNSEQAALRDALENVFPELALARRNAAKPAAQFG